MNRINLQALIVASVVTVFLDLLIGMVMLALAGGPVFHHGMTREQMNAAVTAATSTVGFLSGAMILGTGTTVLGGYLAARLSRKDGYLNGGVFGVLGLIWGMLWMDHYPLWFNLAAFLLTMPAALLGALLGAANGVQDARRA